jgi:hypothetical protein
MECLEAQPFVSVLYDGRRVPDEATQHIRGCASCRQQLHDYAAIGAEMKLVGNRPTDGLPLPAWLASAPTRGRFLAARALTARVMVPRYAVGLAAAVILALSVGLNLMRAQTPVLWFQFEVYPADMPRAASLRTNVAKTDLREPQSWMLRADNKGDSPFLHSESYRPHVAKPGYREPMAWMWRTENTGDSPSFHYVGSMISVLDTKGGQVRLAVRARHYPEIPKPKVLEQDLGNLKGHEYVYVPGETMQIPIEGGGTLVLSGEVSDRQPQFACGFPVEPAANQMILRNFALIRDKHVLSPVTGWATMIDEKGQGICLYVPGEGLFTFALEPFEGAVKGEANWSEAKFKINGHRYDVLSLAQITGGDQPHDIWVSSEANYAAPKQMESGALFVNPHLSGTPN